MTRRTRKEDRGKWNNHLNLILLDPFCGCVEAVLFTSTTIFDNEIFNYSDTLVKTIIQNNRSTRADESFNIYLWTQVPDKLIRSKLLTPSKDG